MQNQIKAARLEARGLKRLGGQAGLASAPSLIPEFLLLQPSQGEHATPLLAWVDLDIFLGTLADSVSLTTFIFSPVQGCSCLCGRIRWSFSTWPVFIAPRHSSLEALGTPACLPGGPCRQTEVKLHTSDFQDVG